MLKRLTISLFSFFIIFNIQAQNSSLTFNKISNYNGLSNNSVNCIFQDSHGYIWFGTLNGLNRYDGNDFLVFHHDPADRSSISNDIISSIQEDKSGKLWIGTAKGLNIYNAETQKFQNFNNNPMKNPALVKDGISTLYSSNESLWIGTANNGLYRFTEKTNSFEINPLGTLSLSDKRINAICEDGEHHLWIGTTVGLNCVSFDKHLSNALAVRHFFFNTNDQHSITDNKINVIYKDHYNNLWIGTHSGLNRLVNEDANLHFERYIYDHTSSESLSNNDVTVIFQDKDDELWAGTDGGGLNSAKVNLTTSTISFAHYKKIPENINSLVQNQVFSMIQDVSGTLWVGTINGIDKINKPDNQFLLFQNDPLQPNSLPNNNVAAVQVFSERGIEYALLGTIGGIAVSRTDDLHENRRNFTFIKDNISDLDSRKIQCIFLFNPETAWVGTKNGLRVLDLKSKQFIPAPAGLTGLPKSVIRQIHRDNKGLIWIGTNQGLFTWNNLTGKLSKCLGNSKPANNNSYLDYITSNGKIDIFSIAEDNVGHIWVGTWGHGLIRFNAGMPEVQPRYYEDNAQKNGLSSNYLTALVCDKEKLWIGTSEGLNLLENEKFTHYDTGNELNGNYIGGLLEDAQSNLWIETLTGIEKFDSRNNKILSFNFYYGNLARENYSIGTGKDSKGYMYFGGINGLISFNPQNIHEDSYKYPITLTDFRIFNRNEPLPEAGRFKTNLPGVPDGKISLNYNQYGFSFEFASLNYKISDRITYAYKLEGIDPNWIYRNANQRFASYTNLNPGTYTLKVKATNEYGTWSNAQDLLVITVLTPWWKTWWAYTIYLLLLVVGTYSLVIYVLEKERLKHSLNLERLEKEKVKEVDELKFRYFTNISHEFRTPLTLILGPLEQLYKRLAFFETQDRSNLILIQHNANHLLRLISQLMDFRKAEKGSLKLTVFYGSISDFINEVKDSFDPLANKKAIDFSLECESTAIIDGWCDFDKLEKILNNLVYNALSFTHEHGRVTIQVSVMAENSIRNLKVRVIDNGEGIAEKDIDKIFETFYQADNQKRSFGSGYGIGLSLSKQLVDLHKGTISVSSDAVGTVFELKVPIDKKNYTNSEITEDPAEITNKQPFVFAENEVVATVVEKEKPHKKPVLLLVDDNEEIKKYLISCFKDQYKLVEATDGLDGLQKAEAIGPDLIISDVMMPHMDGNEFCRKIKTTFATSHIPVILLTALTSKAHLMQGLDTGADAYVTKPFHYDVLEIQVRNLIESRKNLKKHFVTAAITEPKQVTVSSLDEVFLAQAMKVVENHIKDFDYSVDQFVDHMNIGRSVLYRKLKQLTDQSPNEFIRTVRLKKAAQLLKRNSGTIAEIGGECGFIDPGYFAKCFKKQFNVTPKEFIYENFELDDETLINYKK